MPNFSKEYVTAWFDRRAIFPDAAIEEGTSPEGIATVFNALKARGHVGEGKTFRNKNDVKNYLLELKDQYYDEYQTYLRDGDGKTDVLKPGDKESTRALWLAGHKAGLIGGLEDATARKKFARIGESHMVEANMENITQEIHRETLAEWRQKEGAEFVNELIRAANKFDRSRVEVKTIPVFIPKKKKAVKRKTAHLGQYSLRNVSPSGTWYKVFYGDEQVGKLQHEDPAVGLAQIIYLEATYGDKKPKLTGKDQKVLAQAASREIYEIMQGKWWANWTAKNFDKIKPGNLRKPGRMPRSTFITKAPVLPKPAVERLAIFADRHTHSDGIEWTNIRKNSKTSYTDQMEIQKPTGIVLPAKVATILGGESITALIPVAGKAKTQDGQTILAEMSAGVVLKGQKAAENQLFRLGVENLDLKGANLFAKSESFVRTRDPGFSSYAKNFSLANVGYMSKKAVLAYLKAVTKAIPNDGSGKTIDPSKTEYDKVITRIDIDPKTKRIQMRPGFSHKITGESLDLARIEFASPVVIGHASKSANALGKTFFFITNHRLKKIMDFLAQDDFLVAWEGEHIKFMGRMGEVVQARKDYVRDYQ